MSAKIIKMILSHIKVINILFLSYLLVIVLLIFNLEFIVNNEIFKLLAKLTTIRMPNIFIVYPIDYQLFYFVLGILFL